MAHQGRLILHASAVSLKAGECFLFLGDSGYGKSTLAASLLAAGAIVLADDCVELSVHRGRVYARGAFPGLRLRDDSQRQALPLQRELIHSMGSYNGKQVFRVAQMPDAGYRVTQAFALNSPLSPTSDLSYQRIDGMQAVMIMLRGLFRLDPAKDADRGPEFASVCALFAAGLEVTQLAYPRDFERLVDVQRYLLATADSGVPPVR
ncbi:MAG: hypothetical protein HRU51_06310 [Xanthomonadales bacterium]|nr:hypothetical protein [Xanthomonadales bacterium]